MSAALAATATVGDVQFYLLGAALLQPCAALGDAALRRR